eukprot:jgi/Chrzof1/10935/Cz05g17230.t1
MVQYLNTLIDARIHILKRSTCAASILGHMRTGKVFPKAGIPLVALSFVIAYQADMAYGNKTERIRGDFERIINDEEHWFSVVERERVGKVEEFVKKHKLV